MAASAYCTRADVEATFGVKNVAAWADLNNDNDPVVQDRAITRAIAVACELIDATMRNTVHTIPITDSDGNTPQLINEIAATLAGIMLYTARGGSLTRDERTGAVVHHYTAREVWALATLDALRTGKLVLL